MQDSESLSVSDNPDSISTPSVASLEDKMLDTLEIFKYSFSFRDSLFVILLDDKKSLKRLINDFHVIQSSRIFLLVLLPKYEGLEQEIEKYRLSGVPIEYFKQNLEKEISSHRKRVIKKELNSHDVVVIGLKQINSETRAENLHKDLEYLQAGFDIADLYNAKKFLYVRSEGILKENGNTVSHISLQELKERVSDTAHTYNLPHKTISALITNIEKSKREFILIDDAPGALYQEIFTHQGRGTLITDEYPNHIRQGNLRDVFMVSRMMKPYVSTGLILPVSEEELALQIQDFLLYTINESIVAGARMKEYESGIEIAKFFCLPRFRRRGHARALAEKLIENARSINKEFIFSLSIAPGMWDFLKSLGFQEVKRESLPETWKANYNFERKSKAFVLKLK